MTEPRACFNITAEMLEAYKINVMSDIAQGNTLMIRGESCLDVPVELLLWLIDRAQAWERLEHDERVHQGNER